MIKCIRKSILLTISTLISLSSFTQNNTQEDVPNFITQKDASSFLQSYLSPLGEILGAGLNNGWYNTAKPHKLLGFDITLTVNTVQVPSDKNIFNPNDINNFSSEKNSTPTILGSGEGSEIIYQSNETVLNFTMPNQGLLKMNFIPIPIVNAGFGLIKKTEIDIRYLPSYDYDLGFIGKGRLALKGLAVKHDLLQYIPVVGDAIPMSLSIQAGYTKLYTSFNIDDPNSTSIQDIELDVQASTINLIASKKILMITAYGGIGYNSSTTTFSSNTNINIGEGTSFTTFDLPLEIKFETQNELRANLGLRFNITVIALQANHTFSKYPITTIGIGISLR